MSNKMTFEYFDRFIIDLFFEVKGHYMDWGDVLYLGAKNIPEGRLEDTYKATGRIIEMLSDVRSMLGKMMAYEKGYERGLEEAKKEEEAKE